MLRSLLLAFSGEPPEHVFSQHATAGKLRAISHQFEKRGFSFLAYHRDIAEINDELAIIKILSGSAPGVLEFRCPRCNESALDEQPSLVGRIDDGNLEHAASVDDLEGAITWPKPLGFGFFVSR